MKSWKTWLVVGVVGLLVGIAFVETYPLALLAVGACALAWRLNRKLWWVPGALALACGWVLANAAAGLAAPTTPLPPAAWGTWACGRWPTAARPAA